MTFSLPIPLCLAVDVVVQDGGTLKLLHLFEAYLIASLSLTMWNIVHGTSESVLSPGWKALCKAMIKMQESCFLPLVK